MTPPLRVAIDARQVAGSSGGVETVIRGLAQGFGELAADDLEIAFVTYRGHSQWLHDALGAQSRIVEVAPPSTPDRALLRARSELRRLSHRAGRELPAAATIPRDASMDRLAPDVVHYPFQQLLRPRAPYVFHPHDLQHHYLPEYFSPRAMADREIGYRAMCRGAGLVAVASRWVKDDVARQYGVPEEDIAVVLLAPPARAPEPEAPADMPSLPDRYLLYPAANWPHKNHAGLVEAIALLDREGSDLQVVLTGPVLPDHPDPAELARSAGVGDRVHQLGYLSAGQLDLVYRGARGVVVPTKFEAASFPVWEAFARGIPVAASNVTALPEQVGDAGLLFDPDDPHQIAAAMQQLWSDDALAGRLGAAGRERVARYTWLRTAQRLAAHYRRLAGRELTDADRTRLDDDHY